MADDRPAETEVEAIARLSRELEDLRSTALARASRMPTGSIEPTILLVAKPDTLLLQGQTVSRVTYAVLWTWIVDNALAGVSLPFGTGDGSTTFVLPDLRGRALLGATTVDPVGKAFGAATAAISAANLPQHNHSIGNDGGHWHGINNTTLGNHSGHANGSDPVWVATNASGKSTSIPSDYWASWGGGPHNHSMSTEPDHGHGGATGNAGAASPPGISTIQPSYAVNWAIWT